MSKCLDDELYDIYIEDGKQIIESLREIYNKGRADAFNEILNEMRKSPFASDKATFVRKYIDEQLKENDNE